MCLFELVHLSGLRGWQMRHIKASITSCLFIPVDLESGKRSRMRSSARIHLMDTSHKELEITRELQDGPLTQTQGHRQSTDSSTAQLPKVRSSARKRVHDKRPLAQPVDNFARGGRQLFQIFRPNQRPFANTRTHARTFFTSATTFTVEPW